MLEKEKLLSERMTIIKGSWEAVSARLCAHVELEVRTKSFAGLQRWKMEGKSSNELQRIAQNVVVFFPLEHPASCPERCGICPDKQFGHDSGGKKITNTAGFLQENKAGNSRLLNFLCDVFYCGWFGNVLTFTNKCFFVFFFKSLSRNKQTDNHVYSTFKNLLIQSVAAAHSMHPKCI